MSLTIGADPEIFVTAGARLMPAFKFLPDKLDGLNVYWDGFQAEWKYPRGYVCQNNFIKATREALMDLSARAKAARAGAKLTLANAIRIPYLTLRRAEPHHVALGCEPSLNAYGMHGREVPDPYELRWRFAGGHMHFGSHGDYRSLREDAVNTVKALDRVLGVWAVGVAATLDKPVRRKFYGLAGEYRLPKHQMRYGLEYRTLSNFWLAHPAIMQLTFDIGRQCVHTPGPILAQWKADEKETIETINHCDVVQARKILKRNENFFTEAILRTVYWGGTNGTATKNAIDLALNGLESKVKDAHDIPGNWHFEQEWSPDAGHSWAKWRTYAQYGDRDPF